MQILDLSSQVISGTMASHIAFVTSSSNLDSHKNNIFGSTTPRIRFLTALSRLAASSNSLTGSAPSAIGLTNMTEFLASANNVSHHLPAEIGCRHLHQAQISFRLKSADCQICKLCVSMAIFWLHCQVNWDNFPSCETCICPTTSHRGLF